MGEIDEKKPLTIAFRLIICFLIIALGVLGFKALMKMKKRPARQVVTELAHKVAAQKAVLQSAQVVIDGYGELKPLHTLDISAEVKGKITYINPSLLVGGIIESGDILLKIDNQDYLTEYDTGTKRLQILERDYKLAENEFKRVQKLFVESKVGTLALVEKEEQRLNAISDRIVQVQKAVRLAKINLNRCEIKTSFRARITKKNIEKGQYVSPGKHLVSMADDSILELHIPVDSQDVLHWLSFISADAIGASSSTKSLWFKFPEPVSCQINWTENPEYKHTAFIHRISQFDPKTRTVVLVARIVADQVDKDGGFPLVSGMFCKVEIPGKTMENVISLPRWSVSYDNKVFLVKSDRLKTVKVTVERIQNNKAYISKGISEGDIIITTRLVDPLEGILLDVKLEDSEVSP